MSSGKAFNPQSPPAHIAAAVNARKAADEAEAAAQEAERLAKVVTRKTVIVNAAARRANARKFTPPLQKQYLELLRKTGMPAKVAEAMGVTIRQVNDLRRADPDFDTEWKAARGAATTPVVEAMWDLALSGSFAAQKYILENLDPDNWKDPKNIKVEVSGQIESVDGDDRATRVERIRALEARLAERLALRAAGDQIEEELEAEDAAQIEDAELVDDPPQIEGEDE